MSQKKYFLSKKLELLVAGVDEVGCGSLVGPVIAAAVILHPRKLIFGLLDSKSINVYKRLVMYQYITKNSLSWSIGSASATEIDKMNILQARLLAMKRAINNLSIQPDLVLIDGNHSPILQKVSYQCFKHGDVRISIIGAASIIAKVIRDQYMALLDIKFPKYGFAKNKGYPTIVHLQKLKLHGPIIHHRKSFFPVKMELK